MGLFRTAQNTDSDFSIINKVFAVFSDWKKKTSGNFSTFQYRGHRMELNCLGVCSLYIIEWLENLFAGAIMWQPKESKSQSAAYVTPTLRECTCNSRFQPAVTESYSKFPNVCANGGKQTYVVNFTSLDSSPSDLLMQLVSNFWMQLLPLSSSLARWSPVDTSCPI